MVGAELTAYSALAVSTGDVVMNEIAWMGTVESYNNEWIELYNNTEIQINLGGWILRATDGTPTVNISGTIEPHGYFLLERTDDNTLANQAADQIYTGALGNSGEHLELVNSSGTIIDDVNSWGNWFAGDNTTKQTMERKTPILTGSDPTGWGTSANVAGTPRAQNSVLILSGTNSPPESSPSPLQQEQNPVQDPTLASTSTTPDSLPSSPNADIAITYPENIFINELMSSPLGADEVEEWIELENKNNEQVDISLWQIQDTIGAVNTYIFPESSTMPPNGFFVLSRLTTKITLNNDGDSVQLIKPSGEIAQVVNYDKASIGDSYARVDTAWQWTDVPTPGSANIITKPSATPVVSQAPKKSSPQNTSVNFLVKTGGDLSNLATSSETRSEGPSRPLATIDEAVPKTKNSLIYILAPLLALLSATFILFVKKQRSHNKVL